MPPDNSIAALNVPDSIRLSYVSYRMRANKHGRVFVRPRFRQQCAESLYFMGFNWSERRDLNSGPPVPQTGALTGLRYAPPTIHCTTENGRRWQLGDGRVLRTKPDRSALYGPGMAAGPSPASAWPPGIA